jgi:hypothetical protein
MLTVASTWMPLPASAVISEPAAAIPPIFHRKMLRKESESRNPFCQAPPDQAAEKIQIRPFLSSISLTSQGETAR